MYNAIAMAKPVLNDIIDGKIITNCIKGNHNLNLQLRMRQSKKNVAYHFTYHYNERIHA